MRLERYFNRLLDTLYSQRAVEIEHLAYDVQEDGGRGFIAARLRYWDGSLLEFDESVVVEYGIVLKKVSYAYHYQKADGTLVIRFDNSPHHPEIASTFPRHKHSGDRIEAADAPDLHDVLQEIDRHFRS